jgi:6-pyruvoyltetrahydropterin/6-carboxytetrahydropterin synthase
MSYQSTKVIELGSCAFRQWRASHSHCRFLHGYQLIAKLWFGGSELDEKNWVVDFGGLKELKAKLQHVFDHTTCVAADDPELEMFNELDRRGIIQLRIFEKGVGIERVSEEVYRIASEHIKNAFGGRCWVEKVEVFEHEDNSALYVPSDAENSSAETEQSDVASQTITVNYTSQESPAKLGANVGSNVSPGKGNWFAGTTWG